MSATEAIAVTCPNCGSGFRVKREAVGRSVKCPQCDQPMVVETPTIERMEAPLHAPQAAPEIGRPTAFQPRSYPALSAVRAVLRALAVLVLCGWVLVAAGGVAVSIYTDGLQGLFSLLLAIGASLIGTLITVCLLVAVAELINVLVDIQDNTHRTAHKG